MYPFHYSETQQQQQEDRYHPQPQANQNKKRLTQEQVGVLESSFGANKKLLPDLKLELARRLHVPPRQVAVWYQNRRARWKAQTLELDYNTLQLKLDHAAAERRRLEREVARLGHELARAHEMVQLALMTAEGPPPPPPSSHLENPASRPIDVNIARNNSCSSSSDRQWGSSASLNNDIHNGGGEVLEVDEDELYASFMMGGGDGSGSTSSWD
ncbi:unnamed protein product [Linum tenue]|uniref:Homeobox-leucine zipper protein n=1 Tax=Linum tenue TaxID=586396 RepID=A0AAV0JK16_9ROSI|nr:unnamed protein product [Linum tenue]